MIHTEASLYMKFTENMHKNGVKRRCIKCTADRELWKVACRRALSTFQILS